MTIIVVGNEKGGVGKTAIATNLAARAAGDGIAVALCDSDPQGSSKGWHRIRSEEGVLPEIPVFGIPANPITELTSLNKSFDLVIVDIGAQNYTVLLNAARIADLVLVPCGPDQFEIESTLATMTALKKLDPFHRLNRVPAHILLNVLPTNVRSKEEARLREFFAEDDWPVFHAALRDRSAWRTSRRLGLAVHELTGRDADAKAAAETKAVLNEIEDRILATTE
ncbi:chromosome partitioning protein [Oxalobacteraceae bacterium OM1]|nr:chromosome partitioning protein [Oxalobacteraceae bacterium OM1]